MDIIEYTFLIGTGALIFVAAVNFVSFYLHYKKWEARKHGRARKNNKV